MLMVFTASFHIRYLTSASRKIQSSSNLAWCTHIWNEKKNIKVTSYGFRQDVKQYSEQLEANRECVVQYSFNIEYKNGQKDWKVIGST